MKETTAIDVNWPTVEDFSRQVQRTIDEISSDIETYEERTALQTPDDGKNTITRALDALKRPERFAGEHAVAMEYLRGQGVNGASFTRMVK